MGRFCGVENVAVVGWAYSFATFVDDSLKRVASGVCGLPVDPDRKQYRELILEIVTFRTIHEPTKYLNFFHQYANKLPGHWNLIVLFHLSLPNTLGIDSAYDVIFIKMVYQTLHENDVRLCH